MLLSLFSILLLPLSQHAISYITYPESNDVCSLEMPLLPLILITTIQTEIYFD